MNGDNRDGVPQAHPGGVTSDSTSDFGGHFGRRSEVDPRGLITEVSGSWTSEDGRLIHELFEDQARRAPDALALVYGGEEVSYAELSRRSNQVARFLCRKGVGPDRLVGLYFERSPRLVIALLGVLKAGGAYVPLDPAYPNERIAYLLRDSSTDLVLTEQSLRASLPDVGEAVVFDDTWNAIVSESDAEFDVRATGLTPGHLAYVIYTSGSTGEPKGVAAEHRSMVNRITAQAQIAPFFHDDICCQKTSVGFVDAVFETLGPLCYGRPLVLVPYSLATDPIGLARVIYEARVTRLISVPSLAKALLNGSEAIRCLQNLRGWTLSGEELEEDVLVSLRKALPQCRFLNLYGSSEVAGDSTYFSGELFAGGRVPIGKPIQNTRVYILDESLRAVPSGETGEIYVAGVGLARGYLNRPRLTAERFLVDPFSSDPQARMYKTGDFGRWRSDGLIEYRGRSDQQLKIRGFRIEPGEIEAQLGRHSDVKEAVVVAREDTEGEKRLVGYVIPKNPDQPPGTEKLREHLKAVLPDYMVPVAFVALESFPLTRSGKLDRRALPAPDGSAYTVREYEAPQGEREQALADIWADLLRLKRVGRQDNFFELGGDSLLIIQMVERLRLAGLSAEAGKAFANPRLAEFAATLSRVGVAVDTAVDEIPPECEQITPAMLPLVDLELQDIERLVNSVPGGRANIQDIYPLASLQQGLLFHHLLDHENDAYVISMLLSVDSRNHLEDVIGALQWAIDRHDVLRTAVFWENLPQPVQVVCRQATLPVEQVTLDCDLGPTRRLAERMCSGSGRLDLRRAPLMRLTTAPDPHSDRWYALLQAHHLVCDEVSLNTLLKEVAKYLKGGDEELVEPMPYRHHVSRTLSSEQRQSAETFFRHKLGNVDEPTAPFGLLDTHSSGSELKEADDKLDASLAKRVRLMARKRGVSAATLFHAAWALVVSRTAARTDVTYGTVLLGRMHGGRAADQNLGMFINTLPLRLRLHELTAQDLVVRTQMELAELLNHEYASLVEAQRASGVSAPAPLFTSLLNFRHFAPQFREELLDAAGLEVLTTIERTNYPLSVSIDDLGEGFELSAQTDRRIEARRVLSYLETAMASLVDGLEHRPDTPALSLEVLPETERREVVESFNATAACYPKGELLHELLEKQVERTPNAVALEYGDRSLTYAALNAKANQLARFLRAMGVGPEQLVGICVERSLEMVVGILGILKAGGAYVPLDPSYPPERLAFMLEDAAPKVVLIQERLRSKLPHLGSQAVALDREWGLIGREETGNLSAKAIGVYPNNLSYVIYTSGSTGRPKGVLVEHRSVVNHNHFARARYGISAVDAQVLFSSLSFDLFVEELFTILCGGARLVLEIKEELMTAEGFARVLCERGITLVNIPTAFFHHLCGLEASWARVRLVVVGGEELSYEHSRDFKARHPEIDLLNTYGPTEATIISSVVSVSEELLERAQCVPIGRPIANTRSYILDAHRRPQPIGVPGELYLTGDCLARGYLNRPELTLERFPEDPFVSGGRVYRTGDLARWLPDGNLEFLGRIDAQVKIRGFRIEMGEIEAQLARHPGVKEAVVLAQTEEGGEKRLVGYIVAKRQASRPTTASLREHLKRVLPEYMVPGAFVMLDTLPMTPNGKLDRRALPVPDLTADSTLSYDRPRGEVEEILASIWEDLLHVERVGRNDNFFELGGHSLLIVQLRERLRLVGLAIEIRRVFESPTLAELARVLVRGAGEVEVPPNLIPLGCDQITPEMLPLIKLELEQIEQIVQAMPGGLSNIQDIYPLAPLQEGMLFHYLMDPNGRDPYVGATLLAISSRERVDEVVAGLQGVIDRHDMLRTALLWERLPQPVQVVCRRVVLPVEEVELDRNLDVNEQVRAWLRPEQQRLDLRQAPLMRLKIAADTNTGKWFALLQCHHIVADNTSQDIVTSEVIACLQGAAARLPDPLPYRAHVAQALAFAHKQDARAFFRGKLEDITEPTAPFGLLEVYGNDTQIEEANQDVDAALALRLRSQCRHLGVSTATLFHAAWALVVSLTAAREDVVYGTVLLGRLQGSAGAGCTLGVFINTLPLRLPLSGLTAKSLIERTQRELVELLNCEQASLAEAQRCSSVAAGTPLFTTLFNYRHSVRSMAAQWDDLSGVEELGNYEQTNYPITVSVDDLGEGFGLTAQTDRRVRPERLLGYLYTALASLVDALESHPDTPVLSLEVLTAIERQQVIEVFNANEMEYPRCKLIHERFEQQVVLTPQNVAVEHEERALTYEQLNRQANRLARYLVNQGVGPDQVVGICLERCPELIVGVLAILKAGAAYLPLDPNYPVERLRQMLDDAAPKILITNTDLIGVLPETSASTIAVDEMLNQISGFVDVDLPTAELGVTAENLVYVIYTSGSTGRPKGTAMPHRAMVNLIDWHRRVFGAEESYRVLQFAALSFDVAFQEIFSTLCTGGTLVLLDEWIRRDARALSRLLEERAIHRLFAPPLVLQSLAECAHGAERLPSRLQEVIVAGEQLRVSPQIRDFFRRIPGCRLHNHYGPTETHVVTALTLNGNSEGWAELPPIGRPISNTQIYVLNGQMQPAPVGGVGEIYIGGANVSKGYLHRPELTAQRFVADPYSSDPRARLYKTGDLGRWEADGTLEYLGRCDRQVKIRGFRVELAEIEGRLTCQPEVKEAVVVMREDLPGQKRLVAYITLRGDTASPIDKLRSSLKTALPEHMVPSAFVILEKLPVTPSGKLDPNALPAPDLGAYVSRQYEAPQGEVEELLAGIWEELLQVTHIGRNDNFFELGGHSLIATRVLSRISHSFEIDIQLRQLFACPTVATLSAAILGRIAAELSMEET